MNKSDKPLIDVAAEWWETVDNVKRFALKRRFRYDTKAIANKEQIYSMYLSEHPEHKESVVDGLEDQREKDIQELCSQVLDAEPRCWDNPNGPYETKCPFCTAKDYRGGGGNIWASMSELKHDQYCAYLIAKDLSTNK